MVAKVETDSHFYHDNFKSKFNGGSKCLDRSIIN